MARIKNLDTKLRMVLPWGTMGDMRPAQTMTDVYKHLGWQVVKEQLLTPFGEKTETFATIRLQPQLDGTTKRYILGDKLSEQYEIIQNADSVTALAPLVDAGLKPVMSGSIDGGKRVCVVLQFVDALVVGNTDVYARYVIYSNEHTGKKRGRFMLVAVRLVCTNGMVAARDEGMLRFTHKGGANDAMLAAASCLDVANQRFMTYGEQMEALMGTGVSKQDIQNYVKHVFFPKLKTVQELNDNRDKIDAVRSQLEKLFVTGPGSDMVEARGTVYGLYQAANHYLNHDVRSRNRGASFLWGANALTDERALREARALVTA